MRLQLWDTAGQENFDKIRILSYENTKCFIVCFSVVDGVSFSNVKNLWVEEVRQHQPSAKILLVGTKSDLRGKNGNGSGDGSKRGEEVSTNTFCSLVLIIWRRQMRIENYGLVRMSFVMVAGIALSSSCPRSSQPYQMI